MKYYARIVDDEVFEIQIYEDSFNIEGMHNESLVWVECPPDTQQGYRYDGKMFTPVTKSSSSDDRTSTGHIAHNTGEVN
jgi:hypothetical protein